jgi:RNA polymerase sigma factor (sigma-70 family)
MNQKPATFDETIILYDKLIKNQIKQLKIYQQFDDYYQVGLIGLWDAYRKFDNTKSSFSAYAFTQVRGSLLTALRKEHRYKQSHHFYDTTMFEFFQGKSDNVLQKEIMEMYCKRLSPDQRKVIMGRFYDQKTFEEIAAEEGVSLSIIRSRYRYAIKKLKRQHFER